MTIEETEIFINIKDASEKQIAELFQDLCDSDGGWVLKVIEKRFEVFKISADRKTMIMVLSIGDGIVGKCAKYVDDIVVRAAKSNLDNIDFDSFTSKIYPMGFPVF